MKLGKYIMPPEPILSSRFECLLINKSNTAASQIVDVITLILRE
jgi:hypothetical protein